MGKLTSLGNSYRVETFDLSEEQHDIVVEMVKNDSDTYGNYTLDDVDRETIDIWLDDAETEGNTEYAEFLREALAAKAEIVTLTDHLGDFKQQIGEVAIYDC